MTVAEDDAAWPYWRSLTAEPAYANWTPHQLDVAALLARTMAQWEAEQRTLREEGTVLCRSDGGGNQPNPRLRMVDRLCKQVLAMRRILGLTARAKAERH